MRNDARGWVLMEAVILGCIVLSAAAVLGICPQCAASRAVRRAYGCGVLGAAGALWNGGGT